MTNANQRANGSRSKYCSKWTCSVSLIPNVAHVSKQEFRSIVIIGGRGKLIKQLVNYDLRHTQSTNTMDYDIVKCTKIRVFIMQFSFIGKLSWFIDINGEERDQNKLFISRFLNIHQNVYQLTSFGIFLTKLEHQILNITVYGLSLYQWNIVNIVFLL